MSNVPQRANKNAGDHPAYNKLNMSAASIKRKRAYDKAYAAKPAQKKYRAELNSANRKSQAAGKTKVGDSKDASHTKRGTIVFESQHQNRKRNGQSGASTKK